MVDFSWEIIYYILSRLPVQSLYRFRCVCKLWCKYIDDPYLLKIHVNKEPMPIMFHKFGSENHYAKCRVYKLSTSLDLEKDLIFEFPRKKSLWFFPSIHVLGSCNGLILLSRFYCNTYVVFHPLTKYWYELPNINKLSSFISSNMIYGFGFDDSNNSFKIVCVSKGDRDLVSTAVHVLGTNSWRKIQKVPPYFMKGEGVFAHGCVYWLSSKYKNWPEAHEIVYFDVMKEEFGLINPPTVRNHGEQLVDLNGEVGLVYTVYMRGYKKTQVWVLKQKEWVMHCEFDNNTECDKVIGFWNKDGDILMSRSANRGFKLFVYRKKKDISHELNIIRMELSGELDIRMYQSDMKIVASLEKKEGQ